MTTKSHWKTLLEEKQRHWLVTGAAGFIGSNLVETLLLAGQKVTGLDNFSTGKQENLSDIQARVPEEAWARFDCICGDIRNAEDCQAACQGAEIVLHQAALGSVPRSVEDPLSTHEANATGTLMMLLAARDAGIRRFVYASSSSVYGDSPELPKVEQRVGEPLSPYAASKMTNELYAGVFAKTYGGEVIGLRYFNVFGPRQDPQGAYAAVIPRFIGQLFADEPCTINGDGEHSRDFCYIQNVVQANVLAALTNNAEALNTAYNIAVGEKTSLNELYAALRDGVGKVRGEKLTTEPLYGPERVGDVKHSLADISKAEKLLGYQPQYGLTEGLSELMNWWSGQV